MGLAVIEWAKQPFVVLVLHGMALLTLAEDLYIRLF